MTREQVDEVRQRSQTGADTDRQGKPRTVSGPWATDYNEMARKTVIRRAAKYWPSSTDKDEPIGDWIDKREAPIEGGAVETVRLNPGRKEAGRAAALLAADAPPADHDAETGEVIEAETVEDEAGM
jgi:recombination protein RecT